MRNSLLDFVSVPTCYCNGLDAETGCGRLDSPRQSGKTRVIWVEEDADVLDRRNDLYKVSTHLPPISGSNVLNPVVFPPGLERLSTSPAPTGSFTTTNTVGTVVLSCFNALRPGVPFTTTTSGRSCTTSFACTRARSGF